MWQVFEDAVDEWLFACDHPLLDRKGHAQIRIGYYPAKDENGNETRFTPCLLLGDDGSVGFVDQLNCMLAIGNKVKQDGRVLAITGALDSRSRPRAAHRRAGRRCHARRG